MRVLVAVVGVVAVLVGAVWFLQRRLIYFPSDMTVPAASDVIPGARDVELRTSDGLRLGAWYVPADEPDRRIGVLVAPGNAGDRSLRAPLARALAERGLSVLLLDYRGYGGNPGSPSEDGLARDVRAGLDYLVDEAGLPRHRLIYFGESLGGGVVVELATERPPAGLVLRSPYVSLAELARVHYPYLPAGPLLRDRYPLLEQVRKLDVPVTVIYGTADTIVPPEQSRAVAEEVPGAVHVVAVDGARHNDRVLLDGAPLVDAVVDLADRIVESG